MKTGKCGHRHTTIITGVCEPCYRKERRKNPVIAESRRASVRRSAAKKTPRERYDRWLRHTFQITIDDYDSMLEAQEERCAVCKSDTPGGGKAFFCVDHNHFTDRIRGLLCNDCNFAAGRLQDNYILAQALSDYLRVNGGTVDALLNDMIELGMDVEL